MYSGAHFGLLIHDLTLGPKIKTWGVVYVTSGAMGFEIQAQSVRLE